MEIITCLKPVNQDFIRGSYRVQNRKGKNNLYFLNILVFLLFLVISSILYFPILRLDMGISKIKPLSLWEEPSLKKALESYTMSIEETKNAEINIKAEDFIPIVKFSNYTIKRGDTISAIIQKFNLKNMGTVLSVNKIDRAKRIRIGQTLKIPNIDGVLYTVAKGDNLNTIASKYNLPVTTLLDANDLTSQNIQIGEKLFIPGAVISNFDLKKALGELFIYPIYGRLTSRFGYRRDPFTGRKSFHNGIDLATKTGTPIKSTMDGKVSFVGTSPIYGNYIIISHERGYQSMYGHLNSVYVKRGQKLTQGKIIGTVGSTGRSTGPHVHFSVYKNGKVINPLGVLK